MNPWQLGEKRECFLCAILPPSPPWSSSSGLKPRVHFRLHVRLGLLDGVADEEGRAEADGREGGEDEDAEGLRPRHEDDQHELDGVHRRVEAALDAVDEAAGGRVDLLLLNLEVEENGPRSIDRMTFIRRI